MQKHLSQGFLPKTLFVLPLENQIRKKISTKREGAQNGGKEKKIKIKKTDN